MTQKQGYTELTLDILNKSPEAGELLVRLHDKHKLYNLAKDKDPSARAELSAIMAGLLELGLKPHETEIITDVLMGLMSQIGLDLKRAVAERLSVMDDVPLRLVVYLANEEISIADPILQKSSDLNDLDLLYIIKSQSADHWRSIAKRARISSRIIDTLADTADLDTAVNLAENKNITLTKYSVDVFSELAKSSYELAKPLLIREELPTELAKSLYEYVGFELQEYIRENFEAGSLAEDIISDVVADVISAHDGEYYPTMKMIATAENMMEKGFLNAHTMVDNLRRGQVSNFVSMFSVYCSLPIEIVIEILNQKTAQGLAVACKAKGIQKPEFVNMFLLTSRVRGGKVIDQGDLEKALTYYDHISEPVARDILSKSRH